MEDEQDNKVTGPERAIVVEVVTQLGLAIHSLIRSDPLASGREFVELEFDALGHRICDFLEVWAG